MADEAKEDGGPEVAAVAVPRPKGFSFKASVVKAAPKEYRLPPPSSEPATIKPGPKTTGFKAAVAEGVTARPVAARGMFAAATTTAAGPPKPVAAKPVTAAKPVVMAAPAKTVITEATAPRRELADVLEGIEDDELRVMGGLIKEEESRDLYSTEVPETYVPQTRRGFSNFIRMAYRTFQLPEGAITIPEGEKYFPYQKFIRDYMRMETPYRGVLVYHGLGSGKTCTSIATAEALYATAHKKIIVMANYSLKKNYFNEISKCGFRHFQLNNFWVPLDPKEESTQLFANQILGLSGQYIKRARQIWVPDFRKPQSESNYNELDDEDRQEIRRQILSILEWDREKNPSGRVRFIAYNGISAKKLIQMACDPAEEKFFDNAVIVIDEVHNLIRNIQGKIEPFFRNLAGRKKSSRAIPIEIPAATGWRPTICDPETKLYNRGYLFYRLLLEARNSKIVGLSGTPLINFPEEMAIMANILHGYIPVLTGVILQSGPGLNKLIEDVGHRNPYIDFIRATINKQGGGYSVIMTLLPPGIKKLDNERGVMRIPPEEVAPTFEEIVASIQESFRVSNLPFKDAPTSTMEPLLPPFGADFLEKFVNDRGEIKNKLVLANRLSGLISYYKGSQLELMPEVIRDEVVRVPFSLYAMKAYTVRRTPEVERELESKDKKADVSATWAKIYQLGDSAGSNNYKMGSRQACNFAFPGTVARPAAATKREEAAEAAAGVALLLGGVEDKENEAGEEAAAEAKDLEFEGEAEGEGEAAAALAAADEEERLREIGLGEEEEGQVGGGGAWGFGLNESEEEEEEEEDEEEEGAADDFLGILSGGGKEKKEAAAAAGAEDLVEGLINATVGLPSKKPMRKVKFANDEEAKEEPEAPAPTKSKKSKSKPLPEANAVESRIEFSNTLENEYQILSFYADTPFEVAGKEYPTLEHFYQSQKYAGTDDKYAEKIRTTSTAQKAKLLGRSKEHKERDDFRKIKDDIVLTGLRAKFDAVPEIDALLMTSGNAEIVDVSEKDDYWGLGPEKTGKNRLGKLWMQLRDEKREGEKGVAAAESMMKAAEEKPVKAVSRSVKPKSVAAAVAPGQTENFEACKAGRLPGEAYKDACARAKRCLATVARESLLLGAPEGLEMHSPKYAAILKRVNEAAGSSLVYSQFLDMEGIGIFRVAMDVNGYAPIEIVATGNTFAFSKRTEESFRRGPGKQPRYITFSGGEDPKLRSLALDLFNARFSELTESMNKVLTEAGYTDNRVGQICRVFCITSAGAEGLSLKNVRAVHIMEPYWNEVRLRQVKGRAIRIGSHLELPEDQRNVSIYTYISVFPEESQRKLSGEYTIDEAIFSNDSKFREEIEPYGIPVPAGVNTYTLTTDEMIYVISERKRKVIEELEKVMKMAAVDCKLNEEQNVAEGEEFYQCLEIKGNVGDFLYHPLISEDISEASKLVLKAPGGPAGTTVGPAQGPKGVLGTLAPVAPKGLALPAARTVATAAAAVTAPIVARPSVPTAAAPPVLSAAAKAAARREVALEREVDKKQKEKKKPETAKKSVKKAATVSAVTKSDTDHLTEQLRAFYTEVGAAPLKIEKAEEIAKKYKATIWKALKDKGDYPDEVIDKYRAAYEAATAVDPNDDI